MVEGKNFKLKFEKVYPTKPTELLDRQINVFRATEFEFEQGTITLQNPVIRTYSRLLKKQLDDCIIVTNESSIDQKLLAWANEFIVYSGEATFGIVNEQGKLVAKLLDLFLPPNKLPNTLSFVFSVLEVNPNKIKEMAELAKELLGVAEQMFEDMMKTHKLDYKEYGSKINNDLYVLFIRNIRRCFHNSYIFKRELIEKVAGTLLFQQLKG